MTKITVVTGSSHGIGYAIAKELLQNDFKVYGISRTPPNINVNNFVWIECDLSQSSEISRLSTSIEESTIDLLVNNAGTAFMNDSLQYSDEIFQKTFALNFTAPILVCQTLLPKLKNALVINMSSDSDRIGENDFAYYCASKAALNVYFDSIQTKYTEFRVYNLLPDYVDTPLLRSFMEEDKTFDWDSIVKPENIAKLVLNLYSAQNLPTNARIFVITDSLRQCIIPREKAFVFNTSDNRLKTLEESLINKQ